MSQISIILPTHNVEKCIARALESCINQTFKDIEIVVVDDFGNDKSIEIAKEYAKKDERIKIIHNEENLGTFASRNNGVKYSTGEFLMFLDPDDYLELEACEQLMLLGNAYKMCQFSFVEVDSDVKSKSMFKDTFENLKKFKGIYWNICTLFVKKDFYLQSLKELSTIDKKLLIAEDMLAFFFLINNVKDHEYLQVDLHLYNYINNNSSSITKRQKSDKQIQNCLEDYFYILKYIKENKNLKNNLKLYALIYLQIDILKFLFKNKKISYFKYKFLKKIYKFKIIFYKIII
ncbi:glycosyltransferase family 2 protein [Campylobacter coli]|nr:glycosyltransferase family 2 protein [Campylobacter coli]EAK4845861.1 glycosyltransferase family 2 protein [Campylobacter coli]EAL3865428.1 glycosyltransferase family 2 protein [Campylobacter coli]